jgi:two-component system torCAD operon response regulator TorR
MTVDQTRLGSNDRGRYGLAAFHAAEAGNATGPACVSPASVLIVEDDLILRAMIARHLANQGYRLHEASTCRTARVVVARHDVDVILMDVQLPDGSGFDLARQIRGGAGGGGEVGLEVEGPDLMFVSQHDGESDIVFGLDLGAEDYVAKPVNLAELSARLRRVLARRARERRLRAAVARRISLGAWAMDRARTEIAGPDGEVVRLTVGEAAILHTLAMAHGAAVSRADLLAAAGRRHDMVSERTVDVLVARIRRKLSGPGSGRPTVLTVSGRGYRLAGG